MPGQLQHRHTLDAAVRQVRSPAGLPHGHRVDAAGVVLLKASSDEIVSRVGTAEIAPGGPGGEVLFRALHVTLTRGLAMEIAVVPVVDGRRIMDARKILEFPTPTGEPITATIEVPISKVTPAGNARRGVRGTWIGALVEAVQRGPERAFIDLDGVEVEFDVVRETLPGRSYGIEQLEHVPQKQLEFFYFGARGAGKMIRHGVGHRDEGQPYVPRVRTNMLAPQGSAGEAMFRTLYLVFTRSNRTQLQVRVTPRVDDHVLPAFEKPLPAILSGVTTDVVEIPMSRLVGSGSRQSIRGSWFSFTLEIPGGVKEGRIVLDGAELEWEPLRESAPGASDAA